MCEGASYRPKWKQKSWGKRRDLLGEAGPDEWVNYLSEVMNGMIDWSG